MTEQIVPENIAKTKASLLGAVALGGASAWFQPDVAGSDLWWHLASGRLLWSRQEVPAGDPFSFTSAGHEWMNHEWLWDALYWPAYAWHPQLVWALNLLVLIAVFALVYVRSLRASGSALAAGAALWMVAACTHWFLDIRPHLMTLLLVQLVLVTRNRALGPWLWPPLMSIWVNLHAGFVFGLGMVGLLALVTTARSCRGAAACGVRELGASRSLWISLALCSIATAMNPWGLRIFEYPLAYLPLVNESPFRSLVEWHPPGFGLAELDVRGARWLGTFQARFWLLAGATLPAAWIALRRRCDPFPFLLAGVAFTMALASRRFVPLFAVCAAPLVATSLAEALAGLRRAWPALGTARLQPALVAAALACTGWLWSDVRLFPDPLGRWTQRDLYPEAAVALLHDLDEELRILNAYAWGGYLMLHLPRGRVFMDGRANTLYDGALYRDLHTLERGGVEAQAVLDRHRPDLALVPRGPLARALQMLPRPWRIVYEDAVALVLLPPGSPLAGRRPLPQQVTERAQFVLQTARHARARGEQSEAERRLERALRLDPLLVAAYRERAVLAAERGDAAGMSRALDAARAAFPRRAPSLDALEGRLRLRLGDPELALPLLRRGLPLGPFSDTRPLAHEIRRVRAVVGASSDRPQPSPAS